MHKNSIKISEKNYSPFRNNHFNSLIYKLLTREKKNLQKIKNASHKFAGSVGVLIYCKRFF